MTTTVDKNIEFLKAQKEIKDLKIARNRTWATWLKCVGLGVFGSVWQSAQTGNWKPTGVATLVAAPCLFFAAVDMGVTLTLAPPITAAAMFTAESNKQRQRFRFVSPEQADMALMEKGIY